MARRPPGGGHRGGGRPRAGAALTPGHTRLEGFARLAAAIERGSTDALGAALALGAHPDARGADGRTALHLVATAPAHLPCLPVLLDAGAALDACDELGRTPLAVAVTAGHTDVVRTLLAAGADPDGATGTPPLALCLEPGVAAVLLDAGASPSARDHGVPVLVRAAGHGRAAVVGILIAAGAHAPELDSSGRNALHHAAATDSAATVQRLLDAGTDPSLPPLPTLIAAEEGSVEVLRTLLAAGAPTGRPGAPIAETALGVALRMGRWEHVALLRGLADRTT